MGAVDLPDPTDLLNGTHTGTAEVPVDRLWRVVTSVGGDTGCSADPAGVAPAPTARRAPATCSTSGGSRTSWPRARTGASS